MARINRPRYEFESRSGHSGERLYSKDELEALNGMPLELNSTTERLLWISATSNLYREDWYADFLQKITKR